MKLSVSWGKRSVSKGERGYGDPGIFISEETGGDYYGDQNPSDKTRLTIRDGGRDKDQTVLPKGVSWGFGPITAVEAKYMIEAIQSFLESETWPTP